MLYHKNQVHKTIPYQYSHILYYILYYHPMVDRVCLFPKSRLLLYPLWNVHSLLGIDSKMDAHICDSRILYKMDYLHEA